MNRLLKIIPLLWVIFLCFSAAWGAPQVDSSQVNLKEDIQHQLLLEQQRLKILQSDNNNMIKERERQWKELTSRGILILDVTRANLAVIDARAEVDNIKIALASATGSLDEANQKLIAFIQQLHTEKVLTNQDFSSQLPLRVTLEAGVEAQKQRIALLQQSLDLAHQRLVALESWEQQIKQWYQNQVQQGKQYNVVPVAELQRQQQGWIQKLTEMNQSLHSITETDLAAEQHRAALRFKIFELQERLSINQLTLFLSQLRTHVHPHTVFDPRFMTLIQLNQRIQEVGNTLNALNDMTQLVQDKLTFIEKHKKVDPSLLKILPPQHQQVLDALARGYTAQLYRIKDFQTTLRDYQTQLLHIRQHELSVRQSLPGFHAAAWLELGKQALVIPPSLWRSAQTLLYELVYELQISSAFELYSFILVVALLMLSWFFLRKSFLHLLQVLEDSSKRFTSQLLAVFLHLTRRNLGILFIVILLLSLKFFLKMNFDVNLWLSIVVVFLIYRLAITLLRLWLLENEEDITGRDVRFFYGLKWIFALSGIFTVFLLLSHVFPVAYEVRVLFNKVFMLLLLALSLLLFRFRAVLPILFQRAFSIHREYILRAVRLVSIVVPVTLLTNAVIGLIGYVQLAWVIGEYQAIALFTLAIYMILQGLLIDLMELNYHYIVRHFKAGWLWSEALLRPIDRILRLLLLIGTLLIFVFWVGLDKNPIFMKYWHAFISAPLINLVGNSITVPILIESAILIAILYWIAKWSREFAFRGLYAKAKDIGLRNSLATFTQYAVVIVGVIIGLRILGFDLRGLTVVTAAFAAGLGFSLRDLASDWLSGIVLLVERPFRNGDTISLGEFEGEVLSTGIRAIKIRTWDHMEVIIPNADIFTKPFINWTHQDSIVRCVISVKVHRVDDPHRVQHLIYAVLNSLPCVVQEPIPEVFMKEMNESVLEIEVRFYLNLQVSKSRAKIRSEVLFAIWDCFKEHGIQPPYPRYEVSTAISAVNSELFSL